MIPHAIAAADWVQVVGVLGLGGLLGDAFRALRDRKKMSADKDQTVVETVTNAANLLLRPLSEQLEKCQADRTRLEREVARLKGGD